MHAAKMRQGSTATQEQQQQTPQRRRPSGSFLNRSGSQTGFRSPRRRPVLPSATGRQGTAAAAVRRRRCVRVSFDRRRSSRSCPVSLKTDPLINCSISELSELKEHGGEGTHILEKRGWVCTGTMSLSGNDPPRKGHRCIFFSVNIKLGGQLSSDLRRRTDGITQMPLTGKRRDEGSFVILFGRRHFADFFSIYLFLSLKSLNAYHLLVHTFLLGAQTVAEISVKIVVCSCRLNSGAIFIDGTRTKVTAFFNGELFLYLLQVR